LRNAIDEQAWQALQGEFYLDCYFAHHGRAAENPFFRGWLMRRLSEPDH